ncbi:MAG: tRNA (N6-isopentenyl adenosine(37)-C2)-methylthiotransferase MiaB [Clostridiales bacterium]|nr:tRNA (N6-isopentenyl adenosine(37)-C2)-methylthiotransferase MiaB [Clostridiales bacterium]
MENNAKFYKIITYGCQMNLHESEKIAGILTALNYAETDDDEKAKVIVFNTCCIRENASQRAEGNVGALKQLKRKKKDLIIAVGGCMTQQPGFADKFHEKFPFVDIIFGTHNLEKFKDLLLKKLSTKKTVISIDEKEGEIIEGTPKTRTSFPNAWVNITYGCNNFCTYCIVPYVRGRERSRKLQDVVNECKELIDAGYREITLLGQNVNSYGNDLGNVNFATLINEVSKIKGKFRLKFMTNHPKDFTEDLIKAISDSDKTCKCVHLPVQAGSNRILKLMNRRYTREDYLEKVRLLRKYIPDVAITTDIMVSFPTETEEDFLDTLNLVEEVRFAGAFTFIYSKRNGTPAAKMDGQIPEDVSKERIVKLIDAQNRINREQSEQYLNKVVEILCEGYDDKKNMYLGRDTYGRMAYFNGNDNLVGEFVNVKITKTGGISLVGEIVND